MDNKSLIQNLDLLTSAMLRECLYKKVTYSQQVSKFKLNEIEQNKLYEALMYMGYNYVK